MKTFKTFEAAAARRDEMRKINGELRWCVVEAEAEDGFRVINQRYYSGGKYDLSPTEQEYTS